MKRFGIPALVLASLTACSPEVPDSAAGVGFGDYGSYQAAREQQLQGAPAPNNPALSDEQDFSAVTARETIESDRERLAELRQQYEVIEPTALPDHAPSTGPNIVEYALNTTNRVGESIYRRSALKLKSSQRACARYASPDLAQLAFLAAGGPTRDRKNLDPDGDGFACAWDPTPFRLARR